MWLHVADTLTQAAHPIFYQAVEQRERCEKASSRAYETAQALFDKSPDRMAAVEVDCEEPAFLPAFLLYGYAIENLLKGLYVLRNPEVVHDQKVQVPPLHDLVELAALVGYVPTQEEANLLEKISTVTLWSGRYPVARNRLQHGKIGLYREGIFSDPVAAGLDAHTLINKLRKLVDDGQPRPKGGVVVVWE